MLSYQKFQGFIGINSHDITKTCMEVFLSKSDRLPKKGGAAKAMKKLKELRKKEPSDRLVQIIKEVSARSSK